MVRKVLEAYPKANFRVALRNHELRLQRWPVLPLIGSRVLRVKATSEEGSQEKTPLPASNVEELLVIPGTATMTAILPWELFK